MPRNQDDLDRPANSVIGRGFTINAALISGSDTLRIDGEVIGSIELDGVLHLSESGYVEGDVRVSSARVAGQINGNISCRSTLHLTPTAIVAGDVSAATAIVDEGAALRSRFRTGQPADEPTGHA
jgi:cytoskeletal protein CcmA (bactofilin family)